MSKKRKLRYDRIIIFILSLVIVIGLSVFGISKLIEYLSNNNSNNTNNITPTNNNVNPQPVNNNDSVKVSLEDYEVYKDESDVLGFNFIIAKMNFKSDKNISFDLSNFQTPEKIKLNEVSKYIDTLNEKAYRINKLDYVTNINSNSNDYTCNIFIPYTSDSYSLRLYNAADASVIEFDLSKNNKDVTSLKFETEQQIEVGNTNITVSSCSVSTMMTHNGEEYPIASTMNVYTFRIHVSEVEDNVRIIDAKFLRESNGETISCLDESYESEKIGNCLNKNLVVGENGALFFETAVISDTPDYDGFLMLMFNNSNEWIKISTTLE